MKQRRSDKKVQHQHHQPHDDDSNQNDDRQTIDFDSTINALTNQNNASVSKAQVCLAKCSIHMILFAAALVRLLLTLVGSYQDKHAQIKYQDVDYTIFTDAAQHVLHNQSPFLTKTYRYTPLVAYLVIPNHVLFHDYGKMIFCVIDIWLGLKIYKMVKSFISAIKTTSIPFQQPQQQQQLLDPVSDNFINQRHHTSPSQHQQSISCEQQTKSSIVLAKLAACLWLFNPLCLTISTRGNADVIICALVILLLNALIQSRIKLAAVLFATCVHFKLYPIIYLPSILIFITMAASDNKPTTDYDKNLKQHQRQARLFLSAIMQAKYHLIQFCTISSVSFAAINVIFYLMYGIQYLNESLIYHLTRLDTRHNFSIFWYQNYLNASHEYLSTTQQQEMQSQDEVPSQQPTFDMLLAFGFKVVYFLPQIILMFYFPIKLLVRQKSLSQHNHFQPQSSVSTSLANSLCLAFYCITHTFVSFNKVITAQYYIWFFALLPFLIPSMYNKHQQQQEMLISATTNSTTKVMTLSLAAQLFVCWLLSEMFWLVWAYLLEMQLHNTFVGIWCASILFFCANIYSITTIIETTK